MAGFKCKDCEDKYPACSDHCDHYKKVKAEKAAAKEFLKKEGLFIGQSSKRQTKT